MLRSHLAVFALSLLTACAPWVSATSTRSTAGPLGQLSLRSNAGHGPLTSSPDAMAVAELAGDLAPNTWQPATDPGAQDLVRPVEAFRVLAGTRAAFDSVALAAADLPAGFKQSDEQIDQDHVVPDGPALEFDGVFVGAFQSRAVSYTGKDPEADLIRIRSANFATPQLATAWLAKQSMQGCVDDGLPSGLAHLPDGARWCRSRAYVRFGVASYDLVLQRDNVIVQITAAGPSAQAPSAEVRAKLATAIDAKLAALSSETFEPEPMLSARGRAAVLVREHEFLTDLSLVVAAENTPDYSGFGAPSQFTYVWETRGDKARFKKLAQSVYVAPSVQDAKAQFPKMRAELIDPEKGAEVERNEQFGDESAVFVMAHGLDETDSSQTTVALAVRVDHVVTLTLATYPRGTKLSDGEREAFFALGRIEAQRIRSVLEGEDEPGPTPCSRLEACLIEQVPAQMQGWQLSFPSSEQIHSGFLDHEQAPLFVESATARQWSKGEGSSEQAARQTLIRFHNEIGAEFFVQTLTDRQAEEFGANGVRTRRHDVRGAEHHVSRRGRVVSWVAYTGPRDDEQLMDALTRASEAKLESADFSAATAVDASGRPNASTNDDPKQSPTPTPASSNDDKKRGPPPPRAYIPELHLRVFMESLRPDLEPKSRGGGGMLGLDMDLLPRRRFRLPVIAGGRFGTNQHKARLADAFGGLGIGYGLKALRFHALGGAGYDEIKRSEITFYGLPGAAYWFAGGALDLSVKRLGLFADFRYLNRLGATAPRELRLDVGVSFVAGPGKLTLAFLFNDYDGGLNKSFGGAFGYRFRPGIGRK